MAFSIHRIRITGGSPFVLYPASNPHVDHDGGTSVHVLYLSEEEVAGLFSEVRSMGSNIEDLGSVVQNPEQERERLILSGVTSGDTVWPSIKCVSCSWFDPISEPFCGVKFWPQEMVASFKEMEKPNSDLDSCPIPDWVGITKTSLSSEE